MIDNVKLINVLIAAVKEEAFFDNIKVISAFPATKKPTLLKKTVIAVSCCLVDAAADSLGSSADAGAVKINANVYVPFINKEAVGNEVAKMLCAVVLEKFNVSAVNVCETFADSATECAVTKITFTLNDEIEFGGDF